MQAVVDGIHATGAWLYSFHHTAQILCHLSHLSQKLDKGKRCGLEEAFLQVTDEQIRNYI